jgi:hypothetical protein
MNAADIDFLTLGKGGKNSVGHCELSTHINPPAM